MGNEMTRKHLNALASPDRREQDRLRIFSSLGIKPPRTKKERYKLEALLRKVRKER